MKSLVLCLVLVAIRAENPCVQIDNDSGPYCVCNSTYCDTVPTLQPLARGQYQLYSTSKESLGFSSVLGTFSDKIQPSSYSVSIQNLTETHQSILGFGGAFTDATGINIASLSDETQEMLLHAYFGSTGVGYSVGRVPIGGSDFSPRGYTYCDVEDDTLSSFSLQEEDNKYKIPYMLRAFELRGSDNLKLFASAWSAPIWMKNTDKNGTAPLWATCQHIRGGVTLSGFTPYQSRDLFVELCFGVKEIPPPGLVTRSWYTGNGKVEAKYYNLWAEYYLKFFEAYEERNVTFWGVTTQNEPVNGLTGSVVPNNGFNAEDMKKWIKEALGPAIRSSKFSHLKIILHDDQRLYLPLLKWLVLSDEEVVNYADGIGVHFYTDFVVPGSFLNFASIDGKSLFRLATEGCAGFAHLLNLTKAVDLGSWSRAEEYLSSIFTDLRYDAVGWVDWNMALNTSGGPNWISNEVDSPIIVDSSKDEFYKQPMFYALGHFSKFVVSESVRVDSEIKGDIEALSFLTPDGKVVIVLWNKSNEPKSVTVTVENLSGSLNLSAQSINSLLLGL